MKKETYANKLAELLGLTTTHEAIKQKEAGRDAPVYIKEDEIQDFRAAQGILYFLQAPELFTYKVCSHCGSDFMVSRQFVKLCSYTCIEKDLESRGIKWRRGHDLEALAQDPHVYDGNEPIWIRNIPQLQAALQKLVESQSSLASTAPKEPSS